MLLRPPRSTRTDTLCPYTTLFRAGSDGVANVNLVGKVGRDGKAAVQDAPDPVGDTVDQADGAVQKSVDAANLTLATREQVRAGAELYGTDRKSTRLNSSH